MILIEFEGGKTQKFRMEFHPLLTVVEGFSEAQRRDLAARIKAAMTGVDVGFHFNIDIGGRMGPLNDEAIDRLSIRNVKLENVMRASHLPGVQERPKGAGAPDFAQIEEARAALEKAQQRLNETESALERARTPRSPVESNVVEQLTAAHELARATVGDLRIKLDTLPLDDTGEERERRIVRLETIAQAIRDRIKELRVLIDRLIPPQGARPSETDMPSPAKLAEAWIAIESQLEQEAKRPQRAPRWLVESARADLELARQRVEELKAINDTLALPKAQTELVEAQEVWSEVESGEANATEKLREQRADLFSIACGVIGYEVDTVDLVHALRSLPSEQKPSPAENPERERLQRELAAAILDHQDVLHEIRELRSLEIVEPTDEEKALYRQFTAELEEAELREAELGERLAELQVASRRVPLPNPSMIAIVTEERDRAFAAVSAATNKLDQLNHAAQTHGTYNPSVRVPDSELDYSNVQQDEIEVFVLSRIAWLRQSASGESIPLIIDAAFDHLPVTLQLRLLNLLGSVASTVQVIYLASSETSIDWAKRQDEMLAAVVQLERL